MIDIFCAVLKAFTHYISMEIIETLLLVHDPMTRKLFVCLCECLWLCQLGDNRNKYLIGNWFAVVLKFANCIINILLCPQSVNKHLMRPNCAPLLANLFLYQYNDDFIQEFLMKKVKTLPLSFKLALCYIDDVKIYKQLPSKISVIIGITSIYIAILK